MQLRPPQANYAPASTLNGITQVSRDDFAKLVNSAWAHILKQLMAARLGSPANENQLLRAHWIMHYDPQSRKWEGSKSIRGRFDLRKGKHTQLLTELREYVEGLRDSCNSFCDALRPDRGGAFGSPSPKDGVKNNVVLWNQKLLRIGITATFLPLLMAVRKRWPSEPDKYLEILKLCEALAFRSYRVVKSYANYRQSAMFRLAFRVAHGMNFDDTVRNIKREYSNVGLRQGFCEFTNAESPQSMYWWRGLRYFLYEYEQHLAVAKGASPKVGWAQIETRESIEHILPQSIEKQCYWQERFDTTTHEEYKHDIGNLTLTKGNASLSNKPFPDKKVAKGYSYEDSPLFGEQEIAKSWDHWTTESIDQRHAMLLGWAKERWHVDFSDISGDTYTGDLDYEDDEE